jgi:zinc transport system substrate-binding protein
MLLAALAPCCRANAQTSVFVSIAPQADLVERIGGTLVTVNVLVGPGQNHHTFEPTPKQMAELASAHLYFTIGLQFEKRIVDKIRAANPNLKCIDSREGIALRAMETEHAPEETGHEHGAEDPHVWLSPLNAKAVAANICKSLKQADAAHADVYEQNLASVQRDLDACHARIASALAPFKGDAFYVYHPAFGYFADAYGLRQIAVEIEGKEPTAKQLAGLIARAKADRVRVIFVQQQFPKRAAEAIAKEVGGAVVSLDPLAHDLIRNLEAIAERLRTAFQ